MHNVIVLGVGRVGAAMARDLAADPGLRVSAADADRAALDRLRTSPGGASIRTMPANLADRATLVRVLEGHDLAIGAVPGPMGFRTLEGVLEAGVHAVDISFCEQDPFALDEVARRRGRTAIVDAGLAPGLSNLILGHHEARLAETARFECLVGGIPADPKPPWNYRAPFSPIDVIAEYTRPARFRRAGRQVVEPALDGLETVDLPGVGRLEAFLTDGLRTLLRTSRTPDLIEKTLRWPGHADRIRVLRDSGFFDPEPRRIGQCTISPLDLATTLLFDAWRYPPDEADMTVMRVVVDGTDERGGVRHTYHLLDRHDSASDTSSMARTTGYTATALTRLVLDGRFRQPGVWAPETVAAQGGALGHVRGYLEARGVTMDHGMVRS